MSENDANASRWYPESAQPTADVAGDRPPSGSPGSEAGDPRALEEFPPSSGESPVGGTPPEPAASVVPPDPNNDQPAASAVPPASDTDAVWRAPETGGHPAGPNQGWYGGAAQPGQYGQPAYPGQYGQPGYPGPYAMPPAGPAPRGRLGLSRGIAIGLLALALAGGGGIAGGLIVHSVDEGNAGGTAAPSSTAQPVVNVLDRSSLALIVSQVKDSVVSIETQDATGSGVVISADGYILTNNHVVADAQGNTVQVTLSNGKNVSAKIVGTDVKTDLAVVKADATGLAAAKFGDSNALQVGDTVLAIGSPLGLDGSVTSGIVSALNRTISEGGDQQQNPFQQPQQQTGRTTIAGAIQTDAAINPGNSGGALVNLSGQVVGINTAIATSGTGEGNIGVGFAIPGNRAKQVAQALIKGQKVSHPYIGANVATATNNAGAQVASVVSGGPADKAGLRAGDIITKVRTTDIHTSDDLINLVQAANVGDQLPITVNRGGSTTTLTVTIGESS